MPLATALKAPLAPLERSLSTRSHSSATVHHDEHELLLLCARTFVGSQAEAQIAQLLHQDIDWDFLIKTAHQHRVLPLLYRRLTRGGFDSLPPETAMSRLRSAFQANARRNLLLTAELFRVMDTLSANGIPSIPYKGPALASMVYGDLSLRQFADLDLIVPADDVVQARALLVGRGYRPEKQTTDEQLRASTQAQKDITLLHDGNGINLEIHWGITTEHDPICIRPEWLWTNLGTCAISGRSVRTLTPEDLLLVLCVHGAKHRWERLAWLCDIAELVRSEPTLDWNRAVENAVLMGGARILFLGLSLARELLGAEPPPAVLKAIQADQVVTVLSNQVKDWLFSEEPVALDLGEREQFFMRLRERPADRLRVAVRQARLYLAPTARDKEAMPLPELLRWSLYLLRPVRLAGQYGLTPFRRFCKGLFQP
jgi:Uncharacterised nucleotidyltransferase